MQIVFALALTLAAQHRAFVELPVGPLTRITSPDHTWTLVFECPNEGEHHLWLTRAGATERRLVGDYERALTVAWAPGSSRFVVNDRAGSNITTAAVYDAKTLARTDLEPVLLAGFPVAEKYVKAGHAYLEATRWVDSQTLLVKLFGHFDEAPPVREFSLRFRLHLDGRVELLSAHPRESSTP